MIKATIKCWCRRGMGAYVIILVCFQNMEPVEGLKQVNLAKVIYKSSWHLLDHGRSVKTVCCSLYSGCHLVVIYLISSSHEDRFHSLYRNVCCTNLSNFLSNAKKTGKRVSRNSSLCCASSWVRSRQSTDLAGWMWAFVAAELKHFS